MNISIQLTELLDGIRDAYIKDQSAKGIKASGKSAASLHNIITPTSGSLVGAKYFYQQMFGRKPGKFPPIDEILNWIREKRITPRDAKTSERQLAFLFARKIAQSGTNIFQKKSEGLEVREEIKALLLKFRKEVVAEFRIDIQKEMKG